MAAVSQSFRCFDEVARRGSIRKAAEVLHLTAAAVHQQVLNLEAQACEIDASDGDDTADQVADVVIVVDRKREVDVSSRACCGHVSVSTSG